VSRNQSLLAELLRENGYYCVAFTGGGALRLPGFEQGFHEYYWSENLGKVEETIVKGARWLESQPTEPFFLFMQTYETHWPLIRDTFCTGVPRGRLGDLSSGEPLLPPDMNHYTRLTREESLYVETAYDGSVHAACQSFVDLAIVMDELALWENSVVVVLSDHGEEFWDHFDLFAKHDHSSLYGELINVPFLIYRPGLPGTPLSIEVSTVDLVPTVVELLHVDAHSQWDGVSLVPLLNSHTVNRKIPILSLTTPEGPARQPRACIVRNGLKYIEPIGNPVDADRRSNENFYVENGKELYILNDDPFENSNRFEEDPVTAGVMSKHLHQGLADVIRSGGEAMQPIQRSIPSTLEDQLKALGYMEGK
jgi:arylsulfatase A-like enzyme